MQTDLAWLHERCAQLDFSFLGGGGCGGGGDVKSTRPVACTLLCYCPSQQDAPRLLALLYSITVYTFDKNVRINTCIRTGTMGAHS